MRKIVALAVVFALVLAQASVSFAEPKDRFEKGVKNIFNSPQQIQQGLETEPQKAKLAVLGYAGGVIKGTVYMTGKIVVGIVEILTCLFDQDKQAQEINKLNSPDQ